MIEFDVRRTRDDRLVAFHDPEVQGRSVVGLTHDELAAAVGYRPPLVQEVLALADGRVGLDIELKEAADVRRVVAAVRERFPPQDVIFTAFSDEAVAEARGLWPEAGAGLLASRAGSGRDETPAELLARARACGATALGLEHELVVRNGSAWLTGSGLDLYVWTVNDASAIRELLSDAAVDAIITDVPGNAVALRADAGVGK